MHNIKSADDFSDLGWATVNQVASYLNCHADTIWRWSRHPENTFPRPRKLAARCTRWKVSEILEWEAALLAAA
ncbi:helix-turn-helix transcriptional regulator [Celeribacter sp.]|uniref:helix-turn-helix transcriptional regulator n=1 Tax=Celeribacter sp. TaxID=1890673 RepID=UPI003A8E02AE